MYIYIYILNIDTSYNRDSNFNLTHFKSLAHSIRPNLIDTLPCSLIVNVWSSSISRH